MPDPFSDVLRLIQLKSCVYFQCDFWSPWAMQLGGNNVAQFHAVLRGQCVVKTEDKTYHGAPGDIFLFPKYEPHIIADSENSKAVAGQEYMASLNGNAPLFSSGDMSTRLLCGHYEYRNDLSHPMIDELPTVIHLKSFESYAPEMMSNVMPALTREMGAVRPGSSAVIEKLAEILLVQIIRAHVEAENQPTGFLAGLCDSRLAKAVQLVHNAPDEKITLEDMAAAAGMSRSAFALQFKTTVGMAPIAYLILWRMCQAYELLQQSGLSVSQVAVQVGYDSEIAFSRAFKRQFGVSPGKVRKQEHARVA